MSDAFLAWWTSIETDTRKSLLVGARRDPERLHALLRMAYEADRPAAGQPAPASTGREPIYQVQYIGEYASSVWHDATEDAYHTFMPERRRIVYAAPVAARELDVEAEFQAWWNTPSATTGHPPRDVLDGFSAKAGYFAARSAAQGTAPAHASETMDHDQLAKLGRQYANVK